MLFRSGSFRLFADDTNIIYSGNNIDTLKHNAETDLVGLMDWFNINKLALNLTKSNYIVISSKNKKIQSDFNIMAGNAKISRVTSIKYLGIYIDQQLNWQEHINSICKKISPIIGILSKIRHLVTFPILRQLYYALIHPHILYCIEAWGSAYQNHVKPLIILQKRAIRIITFSHPQSHTDQLFNFMKILPFYKLYFLTVCQLVFNELNGASNVNFGFQHRCLTHNYNTRNKHLLSQLKHQTNYFCQSILHIGP